MNYIYQITQTAHTRQKCDDNGDTAQNFFQKKRCSTYAKGRERWGACKVDVLKQNIERFDAAITVHRIHEQEGTATKKNLNVSPLLHPVFTASKRV